MKKLNTKNIVKYIAISGCLLGTSQLCEAWYWEDYGLEDIGAATLIHDVNDQDENGETLLHLAVRLNNGEAIRRLISLGADVNARTESGLTPLHYAEQMGRTDIVGMLLARGAERDTQGRFGTTPFHGDAQMGEVNDIKTLLERDAERDIDDWIDALFSAPRNRVEAAEAFLARDALMDQHRHWEDLGWEIIDVNARDERNATPLHYAVEIGNVGLIAALIDRGANVNAQTDNGGETPLHFAARRGNLDAIRILLAKGAVVSIRSLGDGDMPLHTAVRNGQIEAVEALLKAEGADVNARTENGETPLHLAEQGDRADIVEVLLARGAERDTQNRHGTKLSSSDRMELMELLRALWAIR